MLMAGSGMRRLEDKPSISGVLETARRREITPSLRAMRPANIYVIGPTPGPHARCVSVMPLRKPFRQGIRIHQRAACVRQCFRMVACRYRQLAMH